MPSPSPADDTPSSTNPSNESSTKAPTNTTTNNTSSSSTTSNSNFSLFPLLSQFQFLKPSNLYLKLMKKAAEATGRPIESDEDNKLVVSDELVNVVADRAADYILGRMSGGNDDDDDDKSSSSEDNVGSTKDSKPSLEKTLADNNNTSDTTVGDDENIRNVGLYKIALDAIKYQRDGYIMGTDYASKNADYRRTLREQEDEIQKRMEKEEKEQQRKRKDKMTAWRGGEGKDDFGGLLPESIVPLFQDMESSHQQPHPIITPVIPPPNPILNPQNSLGKAQLVDLGSWFIPSPTVYNSLKPTVLWLCSSDGPLHQPALQSTVSVILSSQDSLNWVMKNNIMWFLQDDAFRNRVKGITRGYIHDDIGGGGGGKDAVGNTKEEEKNE